MRSIGEALAFLWLIYLMSYIDPQLIRQLNAFYIVQEEKWELPTWVIEAFK